MISLNKGQAVNLTLEEGNLRKLDVGLGWQTKQDLDAIAFLIDENDKLIEIVYFKHEKNKNDSVRLYDDLDAEIEGDNEKFYVDLKRLHSNVVKIAIYVNIFKFFGIGKKTFSEVENAYIRLVNRDSRDEICRYNLSENGAKYNAFHLADLVKEGGEWKFKIVGEGCNGSVDKLSKIYK